MIFTWRAIRTTPRERQRRQPKRRIQPAESSTSAAQSNLASIPPDVSSSPHEDNAVQDVVDHFFQPVKVTFFLNSLLSLKFLMLHYSLRLLYFFVEAYFGANS